jgi:phosphopantetheine adenylyltransferase
MAVFLVVAPSSLAEFYRLFRGACNFIIRAIALKIEAECTSETEDIHHYTCRRENLKSYLQYIKTTLQQICKVQYKYGPLQARQRTFGLHTGL